MKKILITSFMILLTVACGKKKKDETKTGTVNLNLTSDTSSTLALAPLLTTATATFRDLALATTATGEGLQSLKMYFRSITLCGSLESSGSGYSNPTGCVDVYSNMTDAYHGTEAPSAAERATFSENTAGKFYDILSETDRALLNTGVAVPEGSYNYGIIETHPWVKIKAKSGTLCTKAAGAVEASATGGDGIVTYSTKVDSLTCGSGNAEEVLTYITNANTNFKFLSPFTVAEGDTVTLDLAFNLAQAVRSIEGATSGNLKSVDADNSFYVPMIRIGAAPRKATETTKVETYLMGLTTATDQVRVQLYYNSADTTKGIKGIVATVLGTATSTESKANKEIYTSSMSQTGDVVTIKSWDGTDKVSFTRGAAGTATFKCEAANPQMLEACVGQTEISLAYPAPTTGDL